MRLFHDPRNSAASRLYSLALCSAAPRLGDCRRFTNA